MYAGLSAKRVGAGAMLALLASASGARADIDFCNNFPHPVFVAIAYQQTNGTWLSRGWLEVDTGQCGVFDTAIRVKTFYFRAVTDPIPVGGGKSTTYIWGKGANFAVSDKDNFQYYDAEKRVLKSTLEQFSKGPDAQGDSVSCTVTFPADGSGTVVTTP